jgi:hypothetical protein
MYIPGLKMIFELACICPATIPLHFVFIDKVKPFSLALSISL